MDFDRLSPSRKENSSYQMPAPSDCSATASGRTNESLSSAACEMNASHFGLSDIEAPGEQAPLPLRIGHHHVGSTLRSPSNSVAANMTWRVAGPALTRLLRLDS